MFSSTRTNYTYGHRKYKVQVHLTTEPNGDYVQLNPYIYWYGFRKYRIQVQHSMEHTGDYVQLNTYKLLERVQKVQDIGTAHNGAQRRLCSAQPVQITRTGTEGTSSINQSIYLFINLSIYLTIYIYISIYLSIYLLICLSSYTSIYI